MSTKINLNFETTIDAEFLSAGVEVRLIRLLSLAQVMTKDGWSRHYEAIIDTGNPISVVPHFIWDEAMIRWLLPSKTTLYGIGEGGVSGRLAEITVVFSDERRVSKPMQLKAHLLDDDRVPFLIGFEDVLTSLKLVSDYRSKKAYLKQ